MKSVGGEIFSAIAIANPPCNECIHALEVFLVQIGKAGGILLCGLDQPPFLFCRRSQFRLPHVIAVSDYINCLPTERLRGNCQYRVLGTEYREIGPTDN
jgi:hypothetical protein